MWTLRLNTSLRLRFSRSRAPLATPPSPVCWPGRSSNAGRERRPTPSKKDGNAYSIKGYHSENEAGQATTLAEVAGARTTGRGHGGIYSAATINGRNTDAVQALTENRPCGPKNGGSTFFPASWNRATVKDAIERGTVQASGDANRIVYGPLPGLDKTQSIRLKVAGDTVYPIR